MNKFTKLYHLYTSIKNKNTNDDNIDVLVEDEIEQMDRDDDIEREEYDMTAFNDDYDDGNFEGEEVENQEDYN